MINIDGNKTFERGLKIQNLIHSQAKEWNIDISFVDQDRFLVYCMDGGKMVNFSSREEKIFSELQKELGIEGECQ